MCHWYFSYSAYASVPDAFLLNVNGTLTLDENIADNGGVKKAYYAYGKFNTFYYRIYIRIKYYQWFHIDENKNNYFIDNWVADHKIEEAKLPGFQEFTSRQMFWISFAQIYCAKWTDDGIFKLISAVRTLSFLQDHPYSSFINIGF